MHYSLTFTESSATMYFIASLSFTERAPRGSDEEDEDYFGGGAYAGYYGEHEGYGYDYEDSDGTEESSGEGELQFYLVCDQVRVSPYTSVVTDFLRVL